MLIMLCGLCQSNMYLGVSKYFKAGTNKYRIEYNLIDENKHYSIINSQVYTYDPDHAESRVIQYLIERTLNDED